MHPDDCGRLHTTLARIYTGLTGHEQTPRPRTEGLLETLAGAYPEDQRTNIPARILALALVEGTGLVRIIGEHSGDGPDHVENRDMIYRMPEVLLIADLAMTRPRLLDHAVRNTDFESVVMPMAAEFADLATRHA